MAGTGFGPNDPLAVKTWSKATLAEALQATKVAMFMGSDAGALVHVKDEMTKMAGASVTFGLRTQLKAAGVAGDSDLQNNEEALVYRNDTLNINQLRNAVRVVGAMSQQFVPFDIRSEGKSGLADWWADRLDTGFLNQICGNTSLITTLPSDYLKYCGMNAPTAQVGLGTTNIMSVFPPTITAESGLTAAGTNSANCMSLPLISQAKVKAMTARLPIRPIRVGSMDLYVAFLHPFQVYSLKVNTSTNSWIQIQQSAMQGGVITNNPIFTGAIGLHDGVLLHESARVPWGNTSTGRVGTNLGPPGNGTTNVARGALCGAQACMVAFGREAGWPYQMKWVEDLFDYENQLGVAASMVYGAKKTVFKDSSGSDPIDFGVVTISTWADGIS